MKARGVELALGSQGAGVETGGAAAVAAAKGRGAADTGRQTVLVAEDEDMVRALLAEILRDAGYRVLQARDGMEAVELFDAHAGQISLVVLDAIMPRLDGRGAYERIAAQAPQMRFLLSSGYGAEGSSPPGVHRLDKPYVPSELLRAVREALA